MELAWEPTHSDLETILSPLGLASKPPAWLCTISVRFIMQALILEKPISLCGPRRSFVLWVVAGLRLYRIWLKSSENIYEYEVKNQHRIQASLDTGHMCSSLEITVGMLIPWQSAIIYVVNSYAYLMASWHLSNQDAFSAWMIKHLGVSASIGGHG